MNLQPNPAEIERAAGFLLNSSSPLMEVGFEISQCGANDAVVELAELLAIPVIQHHRSTCPAGSSTIRRTSTAASVSAPAPSRASRVSCAAATSL
jgi:thiamine pyrophosphate-dependent acetolactate synthase large subunit-like protein